MTTSMQYGSYTLPEMVGPPEIMIDGRKGTLSISQNFVVQSDDSDSDFNTKILAAEAALNTWNQALTITWADQSYRTWSPTTNTAFLTRGSMSRLRDSLTQRRSALCRFDFEAMLPASEIRDDGSTIKGYFETKITVSQDDAGRPTITFEGEYRAERDLDGGGVHDAITTYADATYGAKALAVAWLTTNAATYTGVTGDATRYELIAESKPTEDQAKVITYTLTYRYRVIPEKADGTATSDYIVTRCVVTRGRSARFGILFDGGSADQSRTAPGGGVAGAMGTIPLVFQVDFEVALNLPGGVDYADAAALYDSTIRPFLSAHLDAVWAPSGTKIVQTESQPVMTDSNRMSVSWVVTLPNERQLLAFNYSLSSREDKRKQYRKRADGQEDTFDRATAGRRLFVTQEASGTIVTGSTDDAFFLALIPELPPPHDLLQPTVMKNPFIGRTAEGVDVQIVDFVVRREYMVAIIAGGANGGGGGGRAAEETLFRGLA
jgi:hypothetical protein